MAGFLCDYSNNKVLDLFFGGSTFSPPATLYFGLSQNTANKNGYVTEPSGGGYARISVTNNLANFPAASFGTKSNATVITFSTPTADWGTVQSLFVADALINGNVLAMADLTSPKALPSGSTAPKIAVSALFLSHS